MLRRNFLTAIAAAPFVMAGRAFAQDAPWPTKPITIICPSAAGGATDIISRVIAQSMSAEFGQPFIVEVRAGAGGNLGASDVARATPDGYTLMMGIPANLAINQYIYKTMPYDTQKAFAPVAAVVASTNVLMVHPSLEAKSFAEFVALAKAKPGQLTYGSPGIGSTGHISTELLSSLAGVKFVHAPYRGSAPALTDLIAGHINFMIDNINTGTPSIAAGQVRGLAVTSKERWPSLPDLPAMADVIPGYEVISWFTLVAPAGTPAAIVQKLNGAVNKAIASPDVKTRFAELGMKPLGGSAADTAKLLQSEWPKWEKAVEAAGIRNSM